MVVGRDWGDGWDSFGRRQNANASNDVEAVEEGCEDMFSRLGIAAE